ncbi:MAG: MaoC family dehydratase, partial [Actinomycetota bacterium]
LARAGYVVPDLLCGMTQYLQARQRRRDPERDSGRTTATSVTPSTGGVWVRERFTTHRPLATTDRFLVEGESTGRHVHKGRRYGTTKARTVDSDGSLVATNLTTGLLSYRVEDGVADGVEGLAPDDTPAPGPDHGAAAANPHVDTLRHLAPGQRLDPEPLVLTLAMMAARDTANPDTAIHSDAEMARAAGLERPIAGGSHVLAFALEPILAATGPHALSHGATFDVRWRAPTHCDVTIHPRVTVTTTEPDRVGFDLAVDLADGITAMVGTVTVPLPRSR